MMNTKKIFSTLAAVQKLTAGDGESGDLFGSSVSMSADGGTAMIGAFYDDNVAGSAYVFIRAADGTWSQQAKLTAADRADAFGCSVSLSADGCAALIGRRTPDGKLLAPLHDFDDYPKDEAWQRQARAKVLKRLG